MTTESTLRQGPRLGVFRNWLSLTGLVILVGGFFSFVLLFLLDSLAHFSNPYIGLLTYIVAPGVIAIGLFFTILGVVLRRRRARKTGETIPTFQIDLARPRDRRILGYFLAGSTLFLLATAVLSYHTYHYTESVQFCGQACHTVMKPELVTYSHGPHARVACVECHIGPGATWFVKSKLSGTYQVYAVAFDKYPRPVPTPIKNLRPAQETCEQCHWPQKFVGNLDKTYHYFLGDETNTPFSVRLTMRVGGGDPTHGPVGGIHWHMSVANKVEYIAASKDEKTGIWGADPTRQKIPWVRVTDKSQGIVAEYRAKNFTNGIDESVVRTMDCMDCHNRPAHTYQTPNDAVNLALSLGASSPNGIDPRLPWIKTNALFVLTHDYKNEHEATNSIATLLTERYPADKFSSESQRRSVTAAISTLQQIYRDNFFPEMNASWKSYPNNIGHKDWLGCFRCHDGEHKTADGARVITASDCNACHTILAQGSGLELQNLSPNGQKFKHPGGDVEGACNDCHDGTL